ncbi:MAG: HlyD family efflux transporter periplasmic adaptor subunit [Chitinophagales bacterium]|nr:HlyD family efflux transporter periplasmic adaptor subunit [Chitinophagales bacterium]
MIEKTKFVITTATAIALSSAVVLVACNKTKTTTAQTKSITEAVYASGFLVAANEYKVYAMADGYVVSKNKEAGDNVKAGEEILRIQNDAAGAKVNAGSAALDLARINASEKSPVLSELKSKMKNAEAKFKNDSINLVRYKNMFSSNAVTKSQFDQATLAYEVSQNDWLAAQDNYRRTKEQLQVELKNAESTFAAAGLDFNNYSIKSILNGKVYELYKDLGEAVRRNDVVALVGDADKMILELNVDQSDVDRVKLNQEVVVKLDVTGEKVYKATVVKIYPSMNQNDQSFKVEAMFTENYALNFTRVSVEANIIIAQKENALLIPRALLLVGDEVEVKSLGGNKKVKVKKGMQNLEYVEILEGISAKDELVLPKEK